MDTNYYNTTSSQQDSTPRTILGRNMTGAAGPQQQQRPFAPAMGREYSADSNISTQSLNSDNTYLTATSPSTTMSHEASPQSQNDFDNPYSTYSDVAFSPNPSEDMYSAPSPSVQRSNSNQSATSRPTTSSIGWEVESECWRLYKYVPSGEKTPYWELLPGYTVNEFYPFKIYVDQVKKLKKGVYQCLVPGGCTSKSGGTFGRPADLERHYKNVHAPAEERDSFPCDYKPCSRYAEPFTRKDHYRDHLRDYHKEDLAKNHKNIREEKTWLGERRICAEWWRCRKCLSRVQIAKRGYECNNCKLPCESDRVAARKKKFGDVVVSAGNAQSADSLPSHNTTGCGNCNNIMWVMDMFDQWQACQVCQPAMSQSSNDTDGDWNGGLSSANPYCTEPVVETPQPVKRRKETRQSEGRSNRHRRR